MAFGSRLQETRKFLKLSQDEIATQIGISYRAYTSYERGDRKPPLDFLEKLVDKYKINLNYLIAGKGDMFIMADFEDSKDELLKEVNNLLIKYGVKGI